MAATAPETLHEHSLFAGNPVLGGVYLVTDDIAPHAHDFLARVRAERAATLLTHSTLPAARVGAAVGWDDPTYFARRFRALAGLSPTEYRRHSDSAAVVQPGALTEPARQRQQPGDGQR